jgi:PAS domain S-box-containing protein
LIYPALSMRRMTPMEGVHLSAAIRLACVSTLAIVYFGAGKLGLSLAWVNASATAVWPPTGIAIAALLLFGNAVWPGITLGAFAVNLATSGSVLASAGIAVGNTLEALLASLLVSRFAGGARAFERAQNVFRFAACAGVAAPALGATAGTASLLAAGLMTTGAWSSVWLTWWLGDAGGALMVAPALLLAWTDRRRWTKRDTIETVALLCALGIVSIAVFGGWWRLSAENYPLGFLCIPLVLWPAFRLGQRETALSMVVLAAIAIWGTLRGAGPFARGTPNEALLIVQTFSAVIAVTTASMAALVAERQRLLDQLERRVLEGTEEVRLTNRELREEIAERERVQAALRASESRLLEAQEVAHVGSWEWDVTSDSLWWSEELYRIYGLDRDSFAASYEAFLERVHPEDRSVLHAVVARALEDGHAFALEHRIIRPDGAVRTVMARGRVVLDASGRPVRMLGVGQDVTERKQAEDQRRQLVEEQAARRQAEEASRVKDEFLAMISHELRTPLNAVIGWANLLSTGSLDSGGAARAVQIIERNAQAQARLIEDLLDASRFAAGQVLLEKRPVDVVQAVRVAVDTIEPSAGARHVEIDVSVPALGATIEGDSQRVQQIIANLLSNALKFSPDGGRIAVAVTSRDSRVDIRVADNGRGIDPSQIHRVFDPFWQADRTPTRTHGGLGLGLTIVRSLVEAHGGTVSADSAGPGHGAAFTISLPKAAEGEAVEAGS